MSETEYDCDKDSFREILVVWKSEKDVLFIGLVNETSLERQLIPTVRVFHSFPNLIAETYMEGI
jgi:hypothetical protein